MELKWFWMHLLSPRGHFLSTNRTSPLFHDSEDPSSPAFPVERAPEVAKWPRSIDGRRWLQVEYTYSIPYTGTFLDNPLSYPVLLWVNDAKMMRRIEVYDGMDVELDRDVRPPTCSVTMP